MYMEQLGDRREALAATSLDLGHGDGRGTHVAHLDVVAAVNVVDLQGHRLAVGA
jgi:hypothetical protein